MMKFERQSLKIDIYGQVFEVTKPSVGMAQEYSNKAKNMSEEESADALLDLVEKCGVPKAVTKEMQADHLGQLIEALLPNKKK